MSTRTHSQEIELTEKPGCVFAALHTPSAIRAWWNAARVIVMAREGGVWAVAWGQDEDAPDYISVAMIRAFEPPRRLFLADAKYYARTGEPPFDAQMTIEFIVEPRGAGSVLRVVQDGFPIDTIADEYYEACTVGWRNTLLAIRSFLGQVATQ